VGRIRVLVAGDIYVNRSLVRPFLEDDGYDVVAEAFSSADVVTAVGQEQPDAIVIDDRLLRGRPNEGTIEKIRRAAPDAKVIVMTSAPGPVRRPGADAYLPRGVSLATVSASLGRLLGADMTRETLAAAGVATSGRASAPAVRERKARDGRGGAARFAASVAVPLLVVWGLIAVLTTGGSAPTPPASTPGFEGGIIVVPQGTSSLDDAEASLARMIDAIEAGNYVLATVHATALMDARDVARSVGYSTSVLDAEIAASIRALAALLPPGVSEALQQIFGRLFPVLPSEETPGGGSGLVLGPVTGTGGGTTAGEGAGTTTGGGGDGTPAGGGDEEGAGEGGTPTCTAAVDETGEALGPGDGREWGHSHKQAKDACVSTAGTHKDKSRGHHGEHGHVDKDKSTHGDKHEGKHEGREKEHGKKDNGKHHHHGH
jgi:CheY-like chemotaxis protein